MSLLDNTIVYLCGQIENDSDSAAGWRRMLAQQLPSINPTINVWDPLVKPNWLASDLSDDKIAYGWKHEVTEQTEHGLRCYNATVAIRQICKQLASKCDWIIARISKVFTWGSIDELEIAAQRRIPVFLWLPDGLISIYGISGCIQDYKAMSQHVHFNVESLLSAIQKINSSDEAAIQDPETWMRATWPNASETK